MKPIIALFFVCFASVSVAQTTQPLFGGLAEIAVPEGATVEEMGFRQGRRYEIFLGSTSTASVLSERLPVAKQRWSDARWTRNELLCYRSKKNKREYRFRNLKTSAAGNIFSAELQFTMKDGGKRRTYRLQERKIRVDKSTVITALFVTDNPASWNNEDSISLRKMVMSLGAVR